MAKEFGLIIPTKNKTVVQAPGKRAAIFDEESDSDEAAFTKPDFFKPSTKKSENLLHSKAIDEDPTVFQYDEIYDDIEKKRNNYNLLNKNVEKKPKYINNLLKTAERRKRENERRVERMVQKEREAEGNEFKDKESYVTPSYQKKLEEMKALEEEEKREEYLESIGDVRKQQNLDGFYRYLYDQKINKEAFTKELPMDMRQNEKSQDNCSDGEGKLKDTNTKKMHKKRQYRIRGDSNSDDETFEKSKKEHIPSNLDADSDFSIDSSDSDNDVLKAKKEYPCNYLDIKQSKKEINVEENTKGEKNEVKDIIKQINTVEDEDGETNKSTENVVKNKFNIWEKRTIGEKFEERRKRYFERIALKKSS